MNTMLLRAAFAAVTYLTLGHAALAQCTGVASGNKICASPSGGGSGQLNSRAMVTGDLPTYVTGQTGGVARTRDSKLSDINSIKDYGASSGASAATNSTAIANALAAGSAFVPGESFTTNTAPGSFASGRWWGAGTIVDSSGYKRAPWRSRLSAAPDYSSGDESSILYAFNGDFSKSLIAAETWIGGAATLGQPTSGYLYRPATIPFYHYFYNESGYQHSTSSNDGRTAAVAQRTKVYHIGQGDAVAYNCSGFGNGTRSGSTSFLANPAVVCFNGDMQAGVDGLYLNFGEAWLRDDGYDAAGIAWVANLVRDNATGAKNAFWSGFRVQSEGSADINHAFSATGKVDVGLDFSAITTDANKAAAAFKANDRLYFNASSSHSFFATSLGTEYLTYSSSLAALNFVVNNTSGFQVYSDHVGIPGSAYFAGSTSGGTYLQASAAASGILTLPAATDTLVGLVTAAVLTNKTIDGASNTLTVLAGSQLSGQTPVGNGGTGLSSGTSGGVPYFNSTSSMASSGALTSGAIVLGGGAGAAPNVSGCTINSNNSMNCASTTQYQPQLTVWNQASDAYGPYFQVVKSRAASGAGAASQVGDALGTFIFQGADTGGAIRNGAYLTAIAASVGASSVTAKFQMVAGSSIVEIYDTGTLNLYSGGSLQISSTKVVGARDTGWAPMTGTSDKATAYDTATVTLAQLAGRVMALQSALTTHGLLGP